LQFKFAHLNKGPARCCCPVPSRAKLPVRRAPSVLLSVGSCIRVELARWLLGMHEPTARAPDPHRYPRPTPRRAVGRRQWQIQHPPILASSNQVRTFLQHLRARHGLMRRTRCSHATSHAVIRRWTLGPYQCQLGRILQFERDGRSTRTRQIILTDCDGYAQQNTGNTSFFSRHMQC
jgi:hypothetical protein